MSKRDYYEVLGIGRNATADDIKKAYRNLALKFHPDRVAADKKKESEEKFKEVSEAYEVLMDPQKKANYDQYGHAGVEGAFRQGGFSWQDFHHFDDLQDFGVDLGDILSRFGFGEDVFGGGRGGGRRRGGPQRGNDLEYALEISLEEAAFGTEKSITIPKYDACVDCGGTGAKPGSKTERCSACGGRGQLSSSNGFFSIMRTCDRCGGEGTIIKTPCQSCAGRGRVKVRRNLTVKIPSGVDTGSRLRVHGEGEAGDKGGKTGDLYVAIYVKPHEIFERHGADLYCEIPVSFATAALGGEIDVPTLEGRVTMKVPAGTQSGRVFRLRGKGVSQIHGYGKGDELVRVQVDVPTDMNAEQKRILKEFAKASGSDSGPLSKSFMEKMRRLFK